LLLIFSFGAILYTVHSTNDQLFAAIPELEGLKQVNQPQPIEKVKIAVLQRKIEIAKSDQHTVLIAIGILVTISGVAMSYGFMKWHQDVQPILDRTAEAQAAIAELQLLKLQRELGIQPAVVSDAKAFETTKPKDVPATDS
jgi:hypothetical protein